MTGLPTLPFDQPNPLRLADRLRELQDERPISRVRTPAGDEAWLVTRYAEARALFADERLGRSHPNPDQAAKTTHSIMGAAVNQDHDSEDAEHARMRARLVPCF